MTRVLVLVATDRLSGPARQILQFFEHVDRERFELVLGSPFIETLGRSDFHVEAERRGIELAPLRQSSAFDPSLLPQLRRLVRERPIDILQSHGYKPAVLLALTKFWTGRPWIAFMHGETRENRKVELYHSLNFHAARFADRVVTVSDEMNARYVKRGLDARRVVTVHNAVDPAHFTPPAPVAALRAAHGVDPDETTLGVIGRFSPEKGQLDFLAAFERLARGPRRYRAFLVGEGPQEEELRAFCSTAGIADRVVFTGYQHDVGRVYPLLDVVVMPSHSEGLPNVAMEALHFGCLVVATAVGGTPEVVVDGVTGLLVPPRDPAAMASAIERIASRGPDTERFAREGRALLATEYAPEVKARRLERIYDELCPDGARRPAGTGASTRV